MSWSVGSGLASDVLSLTGIDGDLFVLMMSYNPASLPAPEASLAAAGLLLLTVEDPNPTPHWVNAIDLNHGPNVGAANVQGAWSGQLALGTWGVDIVANNVWAVLDHNSNFSASFFTPVPESASWMGGVPLLALCLVLRRKFGANSTR